MKKIDRILPNFVYALILTRSRFGLLPVIFLKFVMLWPLVDVRISFPLNIFRTNGQNSIKFCICIDIGKIYVIFHKFLIELWPLIDIRILFQLNIFGKNRQNLTKFCI